MGRTHAAAWHTSTKPPSPFTPHAGSQQDAPSRLAGHPTSHQPHTSVGALRATSFTPPPSVAAPQHGRRQSVCKLLGGFCTPTHRLSCEAL